MPAKLTKHALLRRVIVRYREGHNLREIEITGPERLDYDWLTRASLSRCSTSSTCAMNWS